MDFFNNPVNLMSMASAALLLSLTANQLLDQMEEDVDEISDGDESMLLEQSCQPSASEMEVFTGAALHSVRLSNVLSLLGDELGYWVRPRSTAWFSRFLLEQDDDERWIQMFRMTKPAVMSLAELLKPTVSKNNTKYRVAIPVLVRVACTLFKLSHGASLLICSEMFAVGRSTVSIMLTEVVQAVNVVLRNEISWPTGEKLLETEAGFKHLCGLPGVVGALDGTHVGISKPENYPADYLRSKSAGYTLNCQAVVDSKKRFLDLNLGMPGSVKDSRVLRRSSLYHRGMHNTLWDSGTSFDGFSPYLVGDSAYPLLPWFMVPHRGQENLPVASSLFNEKLRCGHGVVENAFGILKLTFRELLQKSELGVTLLPDVIVACAILHNVLLGQSHADVERLLHIIQAQAAAENDGTEEAAAAAAVDGRESVRDDVPIPSAADKRRDLGAFLAQMERPVIG